MQILIAPNAFKHALSAEEAAVCILEGLKKSKLRFKGRLFPVADGGDGAGSLLIKKSKGRLIPARVNDPLGRRISAPYGLSDDGQTAIIELANASGLKLLNQRELAPLIASTRGTGELIRRAMDQKVRTILLCLGGSATIDGGSGILNELGVQFLDKRRLPLAGMPESLSLLRHIDLSEMDKRVRETRFIILCDVNNRLLGRRGAAAVFGPQKGAGKREIAKLEKALEKFRDIALLQTGKDIAALRYGGAAGGVAAGLALFPSASLVQGSDFFLDYTDFDKSLQTADLVITGEGSIDGQTLGGKAPYTVAKRAKRLGIPVIGLAGNIVFEKNPRLKRYFDLLLPLADMPADLETAIKQTAVNLRLTAKTLGDFLATKPGI